MRAYISLGSNIGDRLFYIKEALRILEPFVKNVSEIIETKPVGMAQGENNFLNAVAELETELSPQELLAHLEEIEKKLGRKEKGNYKSRTIDLDILEYEGLNINTPKLIIPHPRIKEREFLCRLLKELKRKKVERK